MDLLKSVMSQYVTEVIKKSSDNQQNSNDRNIETEFIYADNFAGKFLDDKGVLNIGRTDINFTKQHIEHTKTEDIAEIETESGVYYINVNRSIDLLESLMSQYRTEITRSIGDNLQNSDSSYNRNLETEITYLNNFAGKFLDSNGILNVGIVGLSV